MEDLLRLPIWTKRSELYAVWVATEIVAALNPHQVRLHHNEGRLDFAFRETLLASVLTARPLVSLYGEKRSPLSPDARSTVRSEGVQPDYGLWRAGNAHPDSCLLAIECKHYKKSGGAAFTEVLSDYAHSLRFAKIYLVSHGPIGDVSAALPHSVSSRCFTIPYLRADEEFHTQRNQLREAVRDAAGPVPQGNRFILPTRRECVLAIDVSLSMHEKLHAVGGSGKLMELVNLSGAAAVATIDTGIVGFVNSSRFEIELAIQHRGVGTALEAPIQTLQTVFSRVVVVTDADGLTTLGGITTALLPSWDSELKIVETSGAGGQ